MEQVLHNNYDAGVVVMRSTSVKLADPDIFFYLVHRIIQHHKFPTWASHNVLQFFGYTFQKLYFVTQGRDQCRLMFVVDPIYLLGWWLKVV
jgi:hypothetical protein